MLPLEVAGLILKALARFCSSEAKRYCLDFSF